MIGQLLPNEGRIVFKTDAGVVITSAHAVWGPLTSEYAGVEVSPGDVKNTSLFVCWGFTQRFLSARVVDQGDYIWTNAVENYLITGLKDRGSHTELVGFKIGGIESPSSPGGLVSEWGFRSLAQIGDDEQGSNFLTDVNTVGWSSDKPAQVGSSYGSLVLVAVNLENIEITDASQSGLDLTTALTIAFRFKLASTPGGPVNFCAKTDNVNQISYEIFTDSSRVLQCKFSTSGSGGTFAFGVTAASTGTWHSCAVVYNGTDIRVYLNGTLDSNGSNNPKSFSGTLFNSNQKFCIGARSDGANYFDGSFAHFFVFNVAKSAAQVSTWHSNDTWT